MLNEVFFVLIHPCVGVIELRVVHAIYSLFALDKDHILNNDKKFVQSAIVSYFNTSLPSYRMIWCEA